MRGAGEAIRGADRSQLCVAAFHGRIVRNENEASCRWPVESDSEASAFQLETFCVGRVCRHYCALLTTAFDF